MFSGPRTGFWWSWNEELYQVVNNFHLLGFYFCRRAQRCCYVYPLRRNQDPAQRLHYCLLIALALSLSFLSFLFSLLPLFSSFLFTLPPPNNTWPHSAPSPASPRPRLPRSPTPSTAAIPTRGLTQRPVRPRPRVCHQAEGTAGQYWGLGEGQEPVFPYDVCVLCFLACYGDQSGHL